MHRRHVFITLAIFFVGWGVAFVIFFSPAGDGPLPFELTDDGKRYTYDTERLGGKQTVFFTQLRAFLVSLFHGQDLGLTIGILASCAALLYYILATRRPEEA
jgi:hypothetical protein